MSLRKTTIVLGAAILGALTLPAASHRPAPSGTPSETVRVPFTFEENRGQTDSSIRFFARGPGCQFFVMPTEAVLQLSKIDHGSSGNRLAHATSTNEVSVQTRAIKLKFLGADAGARVSGQDMREGKVNYFVGNDPARWQANVPTFDRVRVDDIYPGVSVIYYGNGRRIEYDLVVAPKADTRTITIRFEGADKVFLNENGDLILRVGDEDVRQPKPIIHQTVGGMRKDIAGGYLLVDSQTIKFQIGDYDHSLPLVIDPLASYSTYFGGSGADIAWAVGLDSEGNTYIAGESLSLNLPNWDTVSTNAYTNVFAGGSTQHGDAFIAKLDKFAENIIYRTYIGGKAEDAATALAVDAAGNAYITGYTTSTNFPIVNALRTNLTGSPIGSLKIFPQDVIIAKLGPFGSNLLFSTYLGGSNYDFGFGIALDSSTNIYVSGYTLSTNFPVQNAFQSNYFGNGDGFVLKIDTANSLVYSSYLGGSNQDNCYDVVADAAGNAYLTGSTASTNFPVLNAFQNRLNNTTNILSGYDAFVTKVAPSGTALVYSTYLGGANNDLGYRLARDTNDNIYVTGYTFSQDFPGATTNMPSVTAKNGTTEDAFIFKLDPTGTNRIYTFLFGGHGSEESMDIAVDNIGDAHVVGWTSSTDFPVTNGVVQVLTNNSGGIDSFFAEVNSNGTAMVYSIYLGGSSADFAYGVEVDAGRNTYLAGETSSSNFPLLFSGQDNNAGAKDAFLAKFLANDTLPNVSIELVGTNVVVSWPGFSAEYALVTGTNVISSVGWIGVDADYKLINGHTEVTVPATNPFSYFRLYFQ